MRTVWLDTAELRVERERDGKFVVKLKAQNITHTANDRESHHFARVAAAIQGLGIRSVTILNEAIKDFVVATLGSSNYYIRRMYFLTPPEYIAQWYKAPL